MRRLDLGVATLPAALREDCRRLVLRHQCADGGFRGRSGAADDWYTAFAVRTLALTGGADDALRRASAWIGGRATAPTTSADAACRIQAALLCNLLGLPTPLAVGPLGAALATASGLSAGFLAADAWVCLGRRPPTPAVEPDANGGFAEHAGALPLANATAAALAYPGLRLPAATRARAVAWLAALQGADGGIRAHPAAPAGDLLSSFVGAWAALPAFRLGELARFVQGCRSGEGFGACPGDQADPEFTCYGLATLGLLAAQAGRRGAPPVPPGRRGLGALLLAWPPTRRFGWRLV